MEKKQKVQLKTWSATRKFNKKSGVSITLDDLLVDIRKSEKRMGIPLPDNSDPVNLLDMCHPFLYFNYIVNWQQMPSQLVPIGYDSPLEFAKSVIKEWHDFCWKKHLACVDELDIYDGIDRLRQYNQELIASEGKDGIYLEAGYNVHVERLYQRRQEELDNEASAYEEEQRRLQQERELALAEERAREANKKAEELRRLQQAKENAEQAQRNREFSQQSNSPWSKSVTAKPDENPVEEPQQTPSKEIKGNQATPNSSSFCKAKALTPNSSEEPSSSLSTFERSLQRFFIDVYDYYTELASDGQAEITACGINYIASDYWWQVKVCVKYKLEGVQTEEAILGAAPAMADALRKTIGQFDERKHTHQHIFEMRAEKKRKAEERRRREEEKATLQSQLEQLLAQADEIKKQMAQM